MTKTNQNLEMWSGDDKTFSVTVVDSITGSVRDITGMTIDWHLARRVTTSALVEKATGGSGITITAGSTGSFLITLSAGDTADLAGKYYHEAQVTDGSGNISTVMVGTITINRDLITA